MSSQFKDSLEGDPNPTFKKRRLDYNEAQPSVQVLPTKADGNCFFHAVFGTQIGDTYEAKNAAKMRDEWHLFLDQFESLDDKDMPKPLKSQLQTIFNMFLVKPDLLTGGSSQIQELAEETKNKTRAAQYNSEFIAYESFLKTRQLYESYLNAIRNQTYYVFLEEIPILASLADIQVIVYNAEKNFQKYNFKQNQELRGSYPSKKEIWGEQREAEIAYHQNHYSRAQNEKTSESPRHTAIPERHVNQISESLGQQNLQASNEQPSTQEKRSRTDSDQDKPRSAMEHTQVKSQKSQKRNQYEGVKQAFVKDQSTQHKRKRTDSEKDDPKASAFKKSKAASYQDKGWPRNKPRSAMEHTQVKSQKSQKRNQYEDVKQAFVKDQSTQHKRKRTDSEKDDPKASAFKKSKAASCQDKGWPRNEDEAVVEGEELADIISTQETRKPKGLLKTYHGIAYQVKWLAVVALEAYERDTSSFRFKTKDFESEYPRAKQLDDLVWRYETNKPEEFQYNFLQAKHKLNIYEKIHLKDLLRTQDSLGSQKKDDRPYALEKYFLSYIECKKLLKKGDTMKDVIIATNVDFDDGLKTYFEPPQNDIPILVFMKDQKTPECFKFKEKEVPRKLITELKCTYSSVKEVEKLLRNILCDEAYPVEEKLVDYFRHQIKQPNFINGTDLSKEPEIFRELLLEFGFKNKKESSNKCFDIDQPEEFAKEIVSLISKNIDMENEISIPRFKNIIKNNIDKLADFVLVEDKEEKIRFSSVFWEDEKPPGNLRQFRESLLNELKEKSIESLGEYHFKITKFTTCRDYLVNKETFWTALQSWDKNQIDREKDDIEESLSPNYLLDTSLDDMKREIREFLDRLTFVVNYSQDTLENFITTKCSWFTGIKSDIVASIFLYKMAEALNLSKDEFISTPEQVSMFLEYLEQQFDGIKILGITEEYRKEIDAFDIKFAENALEDLKIRNFLASDEKITFVVTKQTDLSSIKVLQILDAIENYDDTESYIFLSLNTVLSLRERVISAFKSKDSNLLVINCESKKEKMSDLLFDLMKRTQSDKGKQIILITHKVPPKANELNGVSVDKDERNSFSDLDDDSQQELLQSGKVIFQGEEVTLGSLVGDGLKYKIKEEVLSQLSKNEKIEVGADLSDPRYNEVLDYFINRTFQRREKFKIQEEPVESELIIIDSSEKEIPNPEQYTDIVLISDTGDGFEKICNKHKQKNIHWLKKEGSEKVWQRSHNKVVNLRKLVDSSSTSECTASEILSSRAKQVVISAEPGMGKSSVLTKIAQTLKNLDPSLWVVRINLNDHSQYLNKMKFSGDQGEDKNQAIEFLLKAMKLEKTFEQELFKSKIDVFGKVAFLFDGFDEISPIYEARVIQLVTILKDTKVETLWLTTRPNMRNALEDKLGVFSYTLKQLSEDEQETLLRHLWIKIFSSKITTKEAEKPRFGTLARDLIKSLKGSLADEGEFTAIPLHIEMLAEVYYEKIQELSNPGQATTELGPVIQEDLYYLYQSFVDKKFKIYIEEKKKQDTTNAAVQDDMREIKNIFMVKHQTAAMYTLFKEMTGSIQQVVKSLQPEVDELLKAITDGNEKRGIIMQVINGTPVFTHRTFAEYFAALWFTENLTETKVKASLKELIFQKGNERMRNFFDCMLAEGHQIHKAVLLNKIEEVEKALSTNDEVVNSIDKGGRTPLHLAASYGHSKIVKMLLDKEANAKEDTILNWYPFCFAERNGHLDLAMTILKERDANDNYKFKDYIECSTVCKEIENFLNGTEISGPTLLVRAVSGKWHEFASYLLDLQCSDVNAVDISGNTPLKIAAKNVREETVKLLLKKGADCNIQNARGNTPMHFAARYEKEETVKLLLERGADCYVQNARGITPLHLAAGFGRTETVKLFLEKGAYWNIQDAKGSTPLRYAVQYGKKETVELLLDEGADCNVEDADGSTPLNIADQLGTEDIVKVLREKGAHCNIKDAKGLTPLHIAAKFGITETVKTLLEEGEDCNVRDANGNTPLHLAAEQERKKTVKLLLEKGADCNVRDANGNTPLHLAAEQERKKTVKLLLENGADRNVQGTNGNTPLHIAAEHERQKIVKLLLKNKANCNVQNDDRNTPLHIAARQEKVDIVKLLLEKAADCNVQDANGNTPLQIAAECGREDIVKLLELQIASTNCLEKGADCNVKNTDGDTPLLGTK